MSPVHSLERWPHAPADALLPSPLRFVTINVTAIARGIGRPMGKSDGNLMEILGGLVATLGIVLVMTGLSITAWQFYMWQRFDFWPKIALADALAYLGWPPVLHWVGIQRLAGVALETPLTMAMALPGLALCIVGLIIEAHGRGRARAVRLP
jgi:hypothetical protein